MVHLRILVPAETAGRALAVLEASQSVCDIVHLAGVARRPAGDLILCDIAREDASVLIADLRELGIERDGAIAIDSIGTLLSERAVHAVEIAAGSPEDAVVWEQVEATTSESATVSVSFVLFIVLAGLIASVGIYLDSAILIVGAMVVGPEFGPIAGFCVAAVQRRRDLAVRSLIALLVGFPAAIAAVLVATLIFQATGVTPDEFSAADHGLSNVIASPDFLAFFVACCAGAAGMLSLSTAKSAVLIGVFISVTTIPAAANIGVSIAYADWPAARGSGEQLIVNLMAVLIAGTLTLALQRTLYSRRRHRHLRRPGPRAGERHRRARP